LSSGIDRKELVAQDVNANGIAYGGGLNLHTGDDGRGFRGALTYFDALGPAYSKDNALLSSHGYVGMKAQQVGGTLANRFMGWHPTAYVSMFGISDTPHEQSRKSGTRVIHANTGYDFGKLRARASWWTMYDTGVTFFNLNQLDDLTPPFGYAREELRAEERLGQLLGHEVNLDIDVQATEHITVFANGATMLAGPYYAIEVARVAGSALGSKNPANPWAAYLGTKVDF
jgi:hypothetical protein